MKKARQQSVRGGHAATGPAHSLDFIAGMETLLREYGGQSEGSLDDRLLVSFGGKLVREGDPELAIRAAMEALRKARVSGSKLKAGISTGHVLAIGAGADSGPLRLIAGPVSNIARRLAARAGKGQILVSEATYRRTLRSFEFLSILL